MHVHCLKGIPQIKSRAINLKLNRHSNNWFKLFLNAFLGEEVIITKISRFFKIASRKIIKLAYDSSEAKSDAQMYLELRRYYHNLWIHNISVYRIMFLLCNFILMTFFSALSNIQYFYFYLCPSNYFPHWY